VDLAYVPFKKASESDKTAVMLHIFCVTEHICFVCLIFNNLNLISYKEKEG